MGSLPTLLLVATMTVTQAEPEQRATLAPQAISTAIQQLGALDFEIRQRATMLLWQAGPTVEPALRRAAEGSDPEVRLRARSILDDFRFGVFADTPDDVAAIVRQYRREESKGRELLWEQLLSKASIKTLVAIATNEKSASQRRQILDRLQREDEIEYGVSLAESWRADYDSAEEVAKFDEFLRKQVPYFVIKQQFGKAESLLEQSATDGEGIRNWAVFLYLRGTIDEKIEELTLQAARQVDAPTTLAKTQTQLVHMLRIKGDERGALELARQLESTDSKLLQGLLFDQRAWEELASRQNAYLETDPSDKIEALGFAAAYNRLALNHEEFEQNIAAIKETAEKLFGGESLGHCREALFLNGFTDDAIRLLTRDDIADAFQVQIMRTQYADAFNLAGIGSTRQSRDAWLRGVLERPDRSKNWQSSFRIAVQLAQILATVGERHESIEMFEQLANSLKANGEGTQWRQLAESELRAKMVDEAFEHAAQAFDKDHEPTAITLLFVNHSTAAKIWWDIYRELEPGDDTRARLARVRNLFYKRKDHQEVIGEIANAHDRVMAFDVAHRARIKWLHAIGETYQVHQEPERAQRCFESIAAEHGPSAIRLADMLAKQEEWIAASDWYHTAWERDHQPYALYLHGEMLSKAGADDAGRQSKELARLLPLAGASRYDGLASQLAQRGLTEVATKECELLRRCSTWTDLHMFHAIATLSQSVAAKDPLQAAAYAEQRMLNCLQELWHFTDAASYVRIPFEVHRDRAKGLLEQDDISDAIGDLRMCQKIWPGDLNIPETFVPQLDRLLRTEAADELFDKSYELINEACNLFPNSALHHNNAAWLAAKCKRRLEDALAHANRALELVPNEAQYIDTLGEVYFQLDKNELAIDCAKKCIELEPNVTFYQEQLARFQAAQQQPE
ncbi:MAG: hypothetical protein H6822_07120 [Planctomycetaceae bacterium]|nr:hypothetical protein [Planctomycetales bacterium]MCB9921933.1 hypothetical protein [Planctomycetaceae bacterium]